MLLRRTTSLAIALLVFACEPSVPYSTANNPSSVDYAGFDPTGSPPSLPQPNDLALTDQAIATQNATQAAVLQAFKAAGGFPNDQEVPITIDFVRFNIDPGNGAITRSAPPIDVTTINNNTLLLLSISSTGGFTALTQCSTPGPNCYDAPKASDYAAVTETSGGQHGTLTLHKSPNPKSGSRRWDPGQYIVVVRGGPSGVLATGSSVGVRPQAAMYLLITCTPTCANGRDLTDRFNQGLIPGNSASEKANNAAQLEIIRKSYLGPFAAIDATGKFNHSEVATLGTFKVADVHTHVETDPSAGLMPLPSDFLSGPDGHLSPELCSSSGPFGPLGPGLCTVDGFSTTAMILSQTSSTIDASTVNKDTIFLYEISGTSAVRKLDIVEALTSGHPEKTQFVDEPTAIAQTVPGATCGSSPPTTTRSLSTAIGLQPAVPAQVGPIFVPVPPLKEATTYVVLVTDGVQDINCTGLTRSTLAKLVLLDPKLPLSDASGKSLVVGPTDAQAVGLDKMRAGVNLAIATLTAEKSAITRDHIAMAYTFHTQSMKSTAVKLAELPYNNPTAALIPVAAPKVYCNGATGCPDGTIQAEFDAYGVDSGTVPNSNIGTIVEAQIQTFNNLSDATGAFNDQAHTQLTANETITALIALPSIGNPNVTCGALCTVPLVVYRHGLGSARGDMLLIADTLNGQGIAVAAIDADKHGDRSLCAKNSECAGAGSTCQAIASMAGQGDPAGATPGKCVAAGGGAADFVRRPVLCPSGGCGSATLTKGIPNASSNFIIGANLFRIRDSFRQDVIDQSQLIRVLSPDPTDPTCAVNASHPNGCHNAIFTATTGFQIDPTKIWYVGLSAGAINGTVNVAANARVGKAAFSSGGGTFVDVAANSASYSPALLAVLGGLGIVKGSAAYLQFVNVAKWIIDPADPINFALNLSAQTLPSQLSGGAAPAGRGVMFTLSNCDLTVPNPFDALLRGSAPTGAGGPSAFEVLTHVGGTGGNYSTIGQTTCSVTPPGGTNTPYFEAVAGGGAVPHGIIVSWGSSNGGTTDANLKTLTGQVQGDVAAFLFFNTAPPASRNAP